MIPSLLVLLRFDNLNMYCYLIQLIWSQPGTKIQQNGEWRAGDLHVAKAQHQGDNVIHRVRI